MANDDILGSGVIRGVDPSGNQKNVKTDSSGALLIATSTSSSDIVSISSVASGVVIGLSTLANVVSLSTAASNPVTPSIALSSAAAITSVSGSTTIAQLIAANGNRKGLSIASESTSTGQALVAFSSTASLTSWSVPIPINGFYEMPAPVFVGAMSVIHISGVSTLRVTELS